MECLKAIVKGPAVGQAAKGILTAGAYKTVLYSYAKLVKMVKSYSVGLGTNALFSIYCLAWLNTKIQSIVKNHKEKNYVSDRTWSFPDNIGTRDISKLHTGLDKNIKIVRRDEEKK